MAGQNPGNPLRPDLGTFNFSGVWSPGNPGGSEMSERGNEAEEEARTRRNLEEYAESLNSGGCAGIPPGLNVGGQQVPNYNIGTPRGTGDDTVRRMLTLLEASKQRNDMMMNFLVSRLDRLEQAQSSPPAQRPAASSSSVGNPPGRPFSTSSAGDGKLPFGVTMPVADFKSWKTRHQEIIGYRSWLESFLSWLSLLSEQYPDEVKEAFRFGRVLAKSLLSPDQQVRGLRLLSFLRQVLQVVSRLKASCPTTSTLCPKEKPTDMKHSGGSIMNYPFKVGQRS